MSLDHDYHKMATAELEINWAQIHLKSIRQNAMALPQTPAYREQLLLNLDRVEQEAKAIREQLTEGADVRRAA